MRTLLPCALLAFGTSLAQAQALSDPTRPPQVAPGALREATSEAAPAALRLQSVLISPARKLAVILHCMWRDETEFRFGKEPRLATA